LRGDPGDGIPNFLSDDDSFVNPDKRQKPLREKVLQEYIELPPEKMDDNLRKNYHRNYKLMDLLTDIPKDLEEKIIHCYNSQHTTRSKMMHYFISNGLKNLLTSITEFK
jgi:hypothetical protein